MSETRLRCTREFVECFTGTQGHGPWSDETRKARIARAWAALQAIVPRVPPAWMGYSHACDADHIRGGYPPPEFGALYAGFSSVTPLTGILAAADCGAEEYLCVISPRRARVSVCALFVTDPAPALVVFHAGSRTACETRLKPLLRRADCAVLVASCRALV